MTRMKSGHLSYHVSQMLCVSRMFSQVKSKELGLRTNVKQQLYGINIRKNQFTMQLFGNHVKLRKSVDNYVTKVIMIYSEKKQVFSLTLIFQVQKLNGF